MSVSHRDPWRYRCPEGHCSWRSTQAGYYCEVCKSAFPVLRDMSADGEEVRV
jgi:hypothetical protein